MFYNHKSKIALILLVSANLQINCAPINPKAIMQAIAGAAVLAPIIQQATKDGALQKDEADPDSDVSDGTKYISWEEGDDDDEVGYEDGSGGVIYFKKEYQEYVDEHGVTHVSEVKSDEDYL